MNYLTHQLLNAEEINLIKQELSEEILGWEDFTDYKILSVDHADVWEGEAVKKIKVVRSDDQFLHQEEEN